jgi:hypothetical protein
MLYEFCVHTRLGPLDTSQFLDLVMSRLDELEAGEKFHTQTLQCPYCYMDYILDVIDFRDRGLAVLLTKWVNLGAGIDSADIKWQSHLAIRRSGDAPHPHPAGAIRTDFEGKAELAVEELNTDNERKLFSSRQRRPVLDGRMALYGSGIMARCGIYLRQDHRNGPFGDF